MNRISEVQTKVSIRKANINRSYGNGSIGRFQKYSGDLVDLFAAYVEMQMPLPPNSGRGCRVQPDHIDACWGRFQTSLMQLMLLGEEEE
tara:strand:+ start:1027 stop:1293 length:267 start_codon:yes stop_codon:yes gene_type:complete